MRFFALLALSLNLPIDTMMSVRLTSAVSTKTAKAGDAFEAVVLNVVPGAKIHGVVESAKPAAAGERAQLVLRFDRIGEQKFAARLTAVDNARESVDSEGHIIGILESETLTGRLDAGLKKLAGRYAGFASVLGAVKGAVLEAADTDIAYPAGAEMEIQLREPLTIEPPTTAAPARLPDAANLAGAPFRTVAQSPPKPSDITNLLLIGPAESVRAAFADAGWLEAAGLSVSSKLETFRAIAEQRGYKEAPVSVLLLDGRPPDMVFEKLNNTFAKRHHLRIWKRPALYRGSDVWAVAATHDTGIDFSESDRTFIHRIDSNIDRERDKVVTDLVFTGRVDAFQLFDRAAVPKTSENATGDRIETDGRIAILHFK